MSERPPKISLGLRPEMAAYLKQRRLMKKMTQSGLAEQGAKAGIRFDESWVSQWERHGPKEGFIKALAYLDLVDADLPLIAEMARARVEWPDEEPGTLREAVGRCTTVVAEGRLPAALGLALTALRQVGEERSETVVRLYLTAAIIARKADLLALAGHFADRAHEVAAETEIEPSLGAKLAIEMSSVSMLRGAYAEAQEHLDGIAPEALDADPFLRACVSHARGALLQECRDARSAIDHFEKALTEYPGEFGPSVAPCLLAMIALNRAQLGERESVYRTLDNALAMARRGGQPIVTLQVSYTAGRAYTLTGRLDAASRLLREAERLATELGKPLRLFEVRLALLDLAERRQNRGLAKLLKRRLWLDRQLLTLPHRQAQEFDELVGLR